MLRDAKTAPKSKTKVYDFEDNQIPDLVNLFIDNFSY